MDEATSMYLSQIRGHRLLTLEDEVRLARTIESSRRRFRAKLLECALIARQAVKTLRKAQDGELLLPATVEASRGAAAQLRQRMRANLATVEGMLRLNHQDYRVALSKSLPTQDRSEAWQRLGRRRRRAVQLLEELRLRTPKIERLIPTLESMASRVAELREQIREAQRAGKTPNPESVKECRKILIATQETPRSLANRVKAALTAHAEYQAAKRELAGANLRLVVSIANTYRNRGVSYGDLIQDGNAGLMRAVDRYDHRRGLRFSTYAVWWIKQAIRRAVLEQMTVKIPAYARGQISHVRDVAERLTKQHGYAPTLDEVAANAETTIEDTRRSLVVTRQISLDDGIGNIDGAHLRDLLPDETAESPATAASRSMLRARINKVLKTLSYREREIIKLRYGLGDGYTHTLGEIGHVFGVSRERVRQIEEAAMERLGSPAARRELAGFLD